MRTISSAILVAVGTAALVSACASATPGARPHDMSAAQHAAMADTEAESARRHAALYVADASVTTVTCVRGCWTSRANPTAQHLAEAKRYEKMAADHRAASQALRDAESRACSGLPDDDRDTSPFAHREDIASVEPLTINVVSSKAQYTRTVGAVITFRALPGMTAQWLQRVVDCHLARNAALGHDVPEMPHCPLVPKNVTARVTATDSGFAVGVQSDDPDTVNEILRRARALVAN